MRPALAAALAAAMCAAGAAFAQGASVDILIVDRDRVMSQSAPAQALRALEQARRTALRASFDNIRTGLEAEEAEIAALRGAAPPEAFEARVRAFDRRVRAARRSSQEASEALQVEIASARRRLTEALTPVLLEVLQERGASVILDAKTALIARETVDVTGEVIDRFSGVEINFGLEPPPAEGGD